MSAFNPKDWAFLTYPVETRLGIQPRPMSEHIANQARAYIAAICARYPHRDPKVFAVPLWVKFCEAWQETGDFARAMRVI